MSRSRYRMFDDGYPYFITDTIVAWLPVFSEPIFAEIVLESWRFLQQQRGVRIFAYVVMENHVHWIARGEGLAQKVGRFKSYTARCILDEMAKLNRVTMLQELQYYKLRHKADQTYQLWQEGSHPQQIESDEMFEQKVEYAHNNPLRRGYVDRPEHWRYSSARDYAGKPGLLAVETDWR